MKRSAFWAIAALVLAAAPLPALAEDLTFTLINNSSMAIKSFYTSPSNVDDWEEDVLGSDVLESGDQEDITIADGRTQCIYDMKFIMDNNQPFVDRKIDLCSLGSYTLSDN